MGLVGESGSGKSTLARILLRLDEPDSGSALWKGRDLFQLSPAELFKLRRDLQMVFQDPTQSLNPRMTVYQLISEAWVIHPDILPKAKWRERVAELLTQVGLGPEHMGRYPHQFSGGQRQRITIAMALACGPDLLIADEPTTALDVTIQAQILDLLRDLLQEDARNYVTIDKIQRVVAEHFDVRLADMTSKRRPACIAFPRQIAMYLSRQLTRHSLQEIGEAFGGRDHGTVIHACKAVDNMMEQDATSRGRM